MTPNGSWVNLRTQPLISSDVVAKLSATRLRVNRARAEQRSDGLWLPVTCSGGAGWVRQDAAQWAPVLDAPVRTARQALLRVSYMATDAEEALVQQALEVLGLNG